MRRPALVILALTALAGCSPADDAPKVPARAAAADDVAAVARDYTRLARMTKEPVYVDPQLAMLCRGVTQAEVDAARQANGPHAHAAVTIYMNDLAAGAFRGSSNAYPVGSVIVKEKRALSYVPDGQDGRRTKPHDGVGGMIKRAGGYDPEHGDWEYFYFEDANRIERGKIQTCVQCHSGAPGKDYVFGGWAAGR